MIINSTIFSGDLNIPNRTNANIQALIDLTISEREPELLKELFGYGMYKDFIAGLTTLTQRWVDLRDGKEYTVNGKLYEFVGIKKMIANYVWYYFMQAATTNTTGAGQVLPTTENGQVVGSLSKMVDSWNRMSNYVESMVHFLNNNEATYPEWQVVNTYYWDEWYNRLRFASKINVFGI